MFGAGARCARVDALRDRDAFRNIWRRAAHEALEEDARCPRPRSSSDAQSKPGFWPASAARWPPRRQHSLAGRAEAAGRGKIRMIVEHPPRAKRTLRKARDSFRRGAGVRKRSRNKPERSRRSSRSWRALASTSKTAYATTTGRARQPSSSRLEPREGSASHRVALAENGLVAGPGVEGSGVERTNAANACVLDRLLHPRCSAVRGSGKGSSTPRPAHDRPATGRFCRRRRSQKAGGVPVQEPCRCPPPAD